MLLDDVKQMQEQGMSDAEIVQRLREQGNNAKDIDDALNQSKIKSAIYEESGNAQSNQEMQPSLMTQEIPQESPLQYPQQYPQYQQYPQEMYYPQAAQASNEMITEIAEQIVLEKLSEIKKTFSGMSEFRAIIESKVSNIDERLRRIESAIDSLQSAILGKIGSYGQSLQDIQDEFGAMQDSFSKVINPLIDRGRESQPEEAEQEQPEAKTKSEKSKKKTKPDFEDFLR